MFVTSVTVTNVTLGEEKRAEHNYYGIIGWTLIGSGDGCVM
jgi:hypothetical protein